MKAILARAIPKCLKVLMDSQALLVMLKKKIESI